VPDAQYIFSMLLPSVHLSLLWYTSGATSTLLSGSTSPEVRRLMEWNGAILAISIGAGGIGLQEVEQKNAIERKNTDYQ